MTNEIHPHFSPEWGWYWSAYIKEKASEKGKKIQTTEMFWQTDLKNEQHLASLNRPDLYDYFEKPVMEFIARYLSTDKGKSARKTYKK